MLAGSGYRAVETGPTSFRIVQGAPLEARRLPPSEPSHPLATLEPDIVVTALKQPEPLSSLPATIHVVEGDRLRSSSGLPSSEVLTREIPSLSTTSMGPGRNRLFLRGIGDGPLNGFNQGSVAILLDEARLNYDAPDPDWALVDIHQVEILEGPQGPLYGTGALGGIVKISTNRPDLLQSSGTLRTGVSLSQDGDLSDDQSAALNLPIIQRTLAVRAVGYRQTQAGWIENLGGKNDSNRERLEGGRVSIRWSPTERWTADFTATIQDRTTRDSQYVDGQLGSLKRPSRLAEPRDLNAKLAMLTVKGPIGALELTSITSLSWQEASASYDASLLSSVLGTAGPTIVNDDRHYRVFDQEVRIGTADGRRFHGLAGVSLVHARTHASVLASDISASVRLLGLKRSITEVALFGEGAYSVSPGLSLGAGARIFSTGIDDEGAEGSARRVRGLHRIRGAGDVIVTWKPISNATVFLRGATAYRPGGTNVEADASQAIYEADELAGVELGSRVRISRALSFATTLFAARWQHVQADELLSNGLVATINAGNGSNIGVESDLRLALASNLALTGGLLVQSAQLDTVRTISIEDRRLPTVPQAAARLKFDRRFRVGHWDGQATLGLRFSGATHLSFDPAFDRRTSAHGTIDAAVQISRDGWNANLVGDNLTNSKADTFAFGNPFRARIDPQRTPTRPRTIGLSISRNF
jgi:iron complex outermembrane receptor protein